MRTALSLSLLALSASAFALESPLLDDLSRKAFDYFWAESHPSTLFTKDRASNSVLGDSYTVSSAAATGYALAAYAIGSERGWVGRQAALDRAVAAVFTARTRHARQNGWFYHFVDWRTGARVWQSEVSSIDTTWLLMGAILAERSFRDPALTAQVDGLLAEIDWGWMLTNGGTLPGSRLFSHGWTPESGFIPFRWDTYSEHMALYVLALGAWPAMPADSWRTWARPAVNYFGYRLLVGGPLFMHQMSHGFIDFTAKVDSTGWDYSVEATQATLANRRYCIQNPGRFAGYGQNFWGLSASDTPDGYRANGAPGWISDNGTVTPTAAVASVQFTPAESLAMATHTRTAYPNAWGRYGFPNGVNPHRGWQSPDVIGIDLGMMMLGIENARDGLPHRLVMAHPVIQQGMDRIGWRRNPIRITSSPAR